MRLRLSGALKSILVLSAIAVASPSAARELKYAIGFQAQSPTYEASQAFKADLEAANVDLTVRTFPLSLLSLGETSAGLRDGIADIGYMVGPYHPQEYATSNMLAELVILSFSEAPTLKENVAFAGAAAEMTFFNCPGCLEEYTAQNQVYLGQGTGGPQRLACNKKEITSPEQMKGLRVRAPSANSAAWVIAMGGSVVFVPGNEVLEALSQGVVDCTVIGGGDLLSTRVIDVVGQVTDKVPGMIFGGVSSSSTNKDTWKSLNEQQRRAMLDAGAVMSAHNAWNYMMATRQETEEIVKRGIALHEPDADFFKQTAAFVDAYRQTLITKHRDELKIKDAEPLIAKFSELYAKWVGLVENVDSVDAVADLFRKEVFSKVDIATYGL